MPKFTYYGDYNTDEFENDYSYVTHEKIIRHKPKKSNHLGKSQENFNREW